MVNKITAEDLINKGVIGLPDVPGLTTIEMQKKLDEISIDVIIPRFNELIDNTVSASDEFSKLNTYNVGDYCIYQGVLYKCTTAITTAGEWDATKWKATSIDKELKEISSYTESKDVISDKYDSSKTYSVGDYCIYDDTLYKCKTEITSAEEFDSSKWEATNCGKEFEVLNSNLEVTPNINTTYFQNIRNRCVRNGNVVAIDVYLKCISVPTDSITFVDNIPKPLTSDFFMFEVDGYGNPIGDIIYCSSNGINGITFNVGAITKLKANSFYILSAFYITG